MTTPATARKGREGLIKCTAKTFPGCGCKGYHMDLAYLAKEPDMPSPATAVCYQCDLPMGHKGEHKYKANARPATAQHTPGPWTIEGIWPDKQRGHTFEARVWITGVDPEHGKVRLADIPDPDPDSGQMANARLIAAAPRMWALLTDLMDDDDTRQGPMGDEYRAILRELEG